MRTEQNRTNLPCSDKKNKALYQRLPIRSKSAHTHTHSGCNYCDHNNLMERDPLDALNWEESSHAVINTKITILNIIIIIIVLELQKSTKTDHQNSQYTYQN